MILFYLHSPLQVLSFDTHIKDIFDDEMFEVFDYKVIVTYLPKNVRRLFTFFLCVKSTKWIR